MNEEAKRQLEGLLREAAPILQRAEGSPIKPPERGRQVLDKVLDQVFPVRKALTEKEMSALLLKILCEEAMAGFDIASRLEKANIGLKQGGEGVLYGLLADLERSGCICGEWRERGDRMIKLYRSTEKGDGKLRTSNIEAAQLNAWSQAVLSLS